MRFARHVAAVSCCAFAWITSIHAQNVVVLPATQGPQNLTVYAGGNSFAPVGTIPPISNAFEALSTPTGNKLYVITKNTTGSVVDVGVSGNNYTISKTFSYTSAPTAAAITPDGKKLIVLADTVHVIDTATDTEIQNSYPTSSLTSFLDVAISPDSTKAYILSQQFGGSTATLQVFDLTTNTLTAGASFTVPSTPATVTVGPNGLVYATAPGNIYELNPLTLGLRSDMSVQGTPSRPAFTSDGLTAIFGNQTPSTANLFIVDLTKHLAVPIYFNGVGNAPINQVVIENSTHVLGYSNQSKTIYDMTPSSFTAVPATFGVDTVAGTVLSMSSSAENPPQTVYFTTSNAIYKVNLQGTPIPNSYTTAAPTIVMTENTQVTGAPTSLILFGNGESATVGQQFVPIVAKAVDVNGRGLAGVVVTFSSATSGAVINPTSATTNSGGYAVTTVTAPSKAGSVSVKATTTSATSSTITLNAVASGSGGGNGGGGQTSGTITIVSGNGDMFAQFQSAPDPLTFQVTDTNGKPIVNTVVQLTVNSLAGSFGQAITLLPVTAGSNPFTQCPATVLNPFTLCLATDQNGQVSVRPLGSGNFSSPLTLFQTATVTANSVVGSTTAYETVFNTCPTSGVSCGSAYVQSQLVSPLPGASLTVNSGTTLPSAIQVQFSTVPGNQPVSNVGVRVTTGNTDPTVGPVASCAGPGGVVFSNASGLATCDLTIGGRPGAATLYVIEGGLRQNLVPVFVNPGGPAAIQLIQGNNASGTQGQTVVLVARVVDPSGAPLPNIPVTFTASSGLTLKNASKTTDSTGQATVSATFGAAPGAQNVKVTAGSISNTFTLTSKVSFGQLNVTAGDQQAATINAGFTGPLTVQLLDTQGTPLPGAVVNFAATSGSATLSASSGTTDSNGKASVTAKAGANAGPVVVTATIGSLSATFNLTVRLPGPQLSLSSLRNGASFIQVPGLAPGSILTITAPGVAFGVTGVVIPTNPVGPLPTTLQNISVTIGGIAAPIYSIANVGGVEQINVQVPFELIPGTNTTVTVSTPNGSSTLQNVPVLAVQPGIFETTDASNHPIAVAQRLSDGKYVTPQTPVSRGDTVIVYLTGLGQTTPAASTNQPGVANQNILAPFIVGLNNAGVPYNWVRYVEGSRGIYAVEFQIPQNAPTGSYVFLSFGATGPDGSTQYSQGSYISIQ